MRILVSTKKTQGQRKNDFCWVPEGEIVRFGMECGGEPIDGSCGCRRAMVGTQKSTATTTMEVVDREDVTHLSLLAMVRESMTKSGWNMPEADASMEAIELLRIAGQFPVGAIVEKRGSRFQERRVHE